MSSLMPDVDGLSGLEGLNSGETSDWLPLISNEPFTIGAGDDVIQILYDSEEKTLRIAHSLVINGQPVLQGEFTPDDLERDGSRAGFTIGRGESNTICLLSSTASTNHARISIRSIKGNLSIQIADLGSTNGTAIPSSEIIMPEIPGYEIFDHMVGDFHIAGVTSVNRENSRYSQNNDAIAFYDLSEALNSPSFLAVVNDGASDNSRIASQRFHELLEGTLLNAIPKSSGPISALKEAIVTASAKLYEELDGKCATTTAIAFMYNHIIYTANIGDSEIVTASTTRHELRTLSLLHTKYASLSRQNKLDDLGEDREGIALAQRTLSRSIGNKPTLTMETITVGRNFLAPGEVMVMHSDGFVKVVSPESIKPLAQSPNLLKGCEQLVTEAEKLTTDNVSMIAITSE